MANFIHVSTLAVWLCAVAVLSVAAGVPYGPIWRRFARFRYSLATTEHQYRNGVEPYYWLAFGAWAVGIVTGAIGVGIEKSRERAKKRHRATA